MDHNEALRRHSSCHEVCSTSGQRACCKEAPWNGSCCVCRLRVSALRGRKKVLKKGHIAAIAIGAFLVAIMSAYLCFVYILRRFCWTPSPEVRWISSSLHRLFCTLLLPTSCVFRREDDLEGTPGTPNKA
jgi:hypothetical protein